MYLRSSLGLSQIARDMEVTTSDALCLSFATTHGSLSLLTVYRPCFVSLSSLFFDEFSSVLESLTTRNNHLLVIGDLNLHLEDSALPYLRNLPSQFGLSHHVTEFPHSQGATLDLVIASDDDSAQDLLVHPPTDSSSSPSLPPLPSNLFTLYGSFGVEIS